MNELFSTNKLEELKFLDSLPRKIRRFVEIYALTDNPVKAIEASGYSVKSAYSRAYALLQKPEVRRAIEIERNIIRERYNITQEYFVDKLKAIIENKFTKVSEKISALTLLARITGHIKERPPEAKQLVILKQEGLNEKIVEADVSTILD